MDWRGRKVAVIGLGVSNLPLIRFLKKHGACVSGRDKKNAQELGERYQELQALGVECLLGQDYLTGLTEYDAVFLTPGIPKHLPELQALAGRVSVLSEIALVLYYAQGPILGITGSNGKTTTSTLVGEMLKASGLATYVGGNIGTPLIEIIEEIPPDARIVLELSSFQLEQLTLSPSISLVTNISENHLDVHLTMDNYVNAKKHIYLNQHKNDIIIFNYEDLVTRRMAEEAGSQVYFFSSQQRIPRGTYLNGEMLMFTDGKKDISIIGRRDLALIGDHNLENVLAASLMAYLAGATWEAIREVAHNFCGVPHRLEKVASWKGVTYYNDSIATSPSRAIAGLKSFEQPILLIAGGYDKKLSFGAFAETVGDKVRDLVVLGDTAPLIIEAVNSMKSLRNSDRPVIHEVTDLAQAVECCSQLARPGDVVLLSPACASFDQYPDFQARGEHFRQLVKNLSQGGRR